jgi:hypothetical protein
MAMTASSDAQVFTRTGRSWLTPMPVSRWEMNVPVRLSMRLSARRPFSIKTISLAAKGHVPGEIFFENKTPPGWSVAPLPNLLQ